MIEIGSTLGGYRIEGIIGQGGMGVVYRATQLRLDRTVALKVIAEEHVYLTDFGLTKQMASDEGLTGRGEWVGTLDYVAPEQIEGRMVDARNRAPADNGG